MLSFIASTQAQVTITGELKKWHRVTLTIDGVNTSESDATNPFTDYRLNVTFTNDTKTYVVPGFYAADGNAAETSAASGSKWRVHFTPDETGIWNYTVSFRTEVLIATGNNPGTAVPPDGTTGSFVINASDKTGNDFRSKGMLRYTGLHHLQFAETGSYFLKGGTNSPENFLAYHEFDQTTDLGGGNDNTLINGLHQYAPHVQHWQTGNPTWQNGKGKGIIGALNYLASQHINSVYFLTYTIDGGDGRDTWMWTSSSERQRYDCSKLDQWEIVLSHMDSLGIQIHLITQEQENDQSLGDSLQQLSNVRKLYYRELVARFGHHLALQWNIGEENSNTNAERAAFAQYISELDPYDHPIAVHTPNLVTSVYYDTIFVTPAYLQYFSAASLQGSASSYNTWAISMRNKSNTAGRKWAIYGDEQIPSVAPDGSDFDVLRRDALWGNLMGGGAGIEWYFGYQDAFGDIQTEDFTVVQTLWQYTHHALNFFHTYLPFHEMLPGNNLLLNKSSDDLCFAKAGVVYAVYFETGGNANTRLSVQQSGNYTIKWFNPRTGGVLQNGSITNLFVNSPGNFYLGLPPVAGVNDWVVLVTNNYEAMEISMLKNDITCFGSNNGQAQVTASRGVPPYTYQWSNGGNTNTINSLSSGLYTVTVTDAFSQSITGNVTISQPTQLQVTDSASIANGYGAISLTVTGGTPPYSFTWNSGENAQDIDSLASGNYCVTVSDTQGCLASMCKSIVIPQCNVPPYTCSDNNPCTIDSCAGSECISTVKNCDDSNVCTTDACDANGECTYVATNCDDGNACTTNDCHTANGCLFTPLICADDGNLCTIESCSAGQCITTNLACNDQDPCTNDVCISGNCVADPIICNDSIACTIDSCVNGTCTFTAANCDDNNLCTTDNCDGTGECVYINIICSDNIACTVDNCTPSSGCTYTAIICPADNNLCTIESCDNGICVANAINCTDGNACTDDACNQGQCVFTAITCNDHNSCTNDNCANGQCAFTPINCNDNNGCTNDNCQSGICVYSPIVCPDDGNTCTTETCTNGQCASIAIVCNDNNTCTLDACQDGQCVFTPLICNDNIACTNDVCNNGACSFTQLPLQVSSLTLINSTTDLDIRTLKTSDTINLAVTPNVNIRGNVCGLAGSIKFVLNGSTYKTESTVPFSLAGDNSGNYNKWSVSVGLYTLVATPYSGANAAGAAGIAKTITLRVINQAAPACTTNANCNDNNACTNNICQSGQCSFPAINCNDNNPCTNDACNNGICSNTAIICNDNTLCTTDACVNGTCVYTPKNCNDNNACTNDNCNAGNCIYSTRNCADNNACTVDGCNNSTGCTNVAPPGCCTTAADCNDNNACTIDACTNNNCQFTQGGNQPTYLRITNPAKSWRKLKIAYSSSSYYSPKMNVSATGNNQICLTLRTVGTPEWSKIQVRPQGSTSGVTLSSYITGAVANWTTFCIPLSAFSANVFTQLSFLELPYSNGAAAFEIHLQKIAFTGGTTPFLWFGDTKTNNLHDGQSGSGSALIATLIQGNPCALKTDSIEPGVEEFHLNAFPNPFNDKMTIEFMFPELINARLEIYSASGQLLDILFNDNAEANLLHKFEYTPNNISDGIIIYKLQTPKAVHYGKAVMLN